MSEWISVKDRYPYLMQTKNKAGMSSKDVLITDGIRIMIYSAHSFDGLKISFGCLNATHWMPLPEPPISA